LPNGNVIELFFLQGLQGSAVVGLGLDEFIN